MNSKTITDKKNSDKKKPTQVLLKDAHIQTELFKKGIVVISNKTNISSKTNTITASSYKLGSRDIAIGKFNNVPEKTKNMKEAVQLNLRRQATASGKSDLPYGEWNIIVLNADDDVVKMDASKFATDTILLIRQETSFTAYFGRKRKLIVDAKLIDEADKIKITKIQDELKSNIGNEKTIKTKREELLALQFPVAINCKLKQNAFSTEENKLLKQMINATVTKKTNFFNQMSGNTIGFSGENFESVYHQLVVKIIEKSTLIPSSVHLSTPQHRDEVYTPILIPDATDRNPSRKIGFYAHYWFAREHDAIQISNKNLQQETISSSSENAAVLNQNAPADISLEISNLSTAINSGTNAFKSAPSISDTSTDIFNTFRNVQRNQISTQPHTSKKNPTPKVKNRAVKKTLSSSDDPLFEFKGVETAAMAICLFGYALQGKCAYNQFMALIKHKLPLYQGQQIVEIDYDQNVASVYEDFCLAEFEAQCKLLKFHSSDSGDSEKTLTINVHVPWWDYILFLITLFVQNDMQLTPLISAMPIILQKGFDMAERLKQIGDRMNIDVQAVNPFSNLFGDLEDEIREKCKLVDDHLHYPDFQKYDLHDFRANEWSKKILTKVGLLTDVASNTANVENINFISGVLAKINPDCKDDLKNAAANILSRYNLNPADFNNTGCLSQFINLFSHFIEGQEPQSPIQFNVDSNLDWVSKQLDHHLSGYNEALVQHKNKGVTLSDSYTQAKHETKQFTLADYFELKMVENCLSTLTSNHHHEKQQAVWSIFKNNMLSKNPDFFSNTNALLQIANAVIVGEAAFGKRSGTVVSCHNLCERQIPVMLSSLTQDDVSRFANVLNITIIDPVVANDTSDAFYYSRIPQTKCAQIVIELGLLAKGRSNIAACSDLRTSQKTEEIPNTHNSLTRRF